ncbi:MAG: glutathione S-transferase C-terminal domain-containing protein [Myxococcota bacterium]
MSQTYVDLATARDQSGLRVVLTQGVPGPWGEAAKGVLHAKGLAFTRVAQQGGADNDALFAWTGHRNAPVVVFDEQPPRTGWSEILWLAEHLAPEPSLLPDASEDRVACYGLSHLLMGEGGFGWCRRLMMFHGLMDAEGKLPEALQPTLGRMVVQYGYSRAAAEVAERRVVEILGLLSDRLAAQRAAGRDFLVGDRLSALDIYWAAMAALVAPLPPDVCAMPDMLRASYQNTGDRIAKAVDPELLAHRDRIYRDHLEFPLSL